MDWSSVLIWWLLAELFGWLALPLAYRLFRRLPDRGYGISKALGLLSVWGRSRVPIPAAGMTAFISTPMDRAST